MDEVAYDARRRAVAFHNHGIELVSVDKQMAYRTLCSATAVDPTMAAGWYALGNATSDMQMYSAAVAAFRRCLDCPENGNPGDLDPTLRGKALVQYAHRLLNDGRIEESYLATRDAIAYLSEHPDLPIDERGFAYTSMSQVLSIMDQPESAIAFARKGFEIDPRADIETGLAFALMFGGEYAEGLKHFEARMPYKIPQYMRYPYPRWDGAKVGTLFIAADQGMGDTLCMTRFLPLASMRAERVIYQVQPEAVRMFTHALRHWGNIHVTPQESAFPVADAWCPIFSMPHTLGLTTEEIRDAPQRWVVPKEAGIVPIGWKARGRKLHIGIAYSGNPANEIDRWRSIPVTAFLELYRVSGVQLYSLQVGDRAQDLHLNGCASLIRDMSPWIRDISDTAAIIRELDLVVSIESFVAHLCGAMNHPCLVLVSRNGGDWRCGRSGDRQLWYPKNKIIRQGADAAWRPVFDEAVRQVQDIVDGKQDGR